MTPLVASTLAAGVVSLFSLSGCAVLFGRKNLIEQAAPYLTDIAAGGFLAAVFLDLLPEAVHDIGLAWSLLGAAIGFVVFELVNRAVPGHSHDHAPCDAHARPVKPWMIIFGDGLHNFTDGVALAAAFLVDFRLGLTLTLATIVHEIPQELGDFGLLIASGLSVTRALVLNLLSGFTAILGAILGCLIAESVQGTIGPMHAGVAGGFLYMVWAISSHHGLARYMKSKHLATAAIGFGLVALAAHLG